MDSLIGVMTAGAVALLMLSVAGIAAAWVLSRAMDRVSGVQFRQVLGVIRSSAPAAAQYYGLRWLGICLLIGFLFSRAV